MSWGRICIPMEIAWSSFLGSLLDSSSLQSETSLEND